MIATLGPAPAKAKARSRRTSMGGSGSGAGRSRPRPVIATERGRASRTGREGGFTLVEVMVALLIFSILATAGVALLSFSVRAQAATGAKLDDLAALQRTLSILSADLAQASDRPARDEAGTTLPAFVGEAGGGTGQPMLRLVRGGWTNLDAQPRPAVQKVAYRLDGTTLQRIAWPPRLCSTGSAR